MKKLKVKDWFMFGEWYGVSWFHARYFYGLTRTIKERLGYGLSQSVIEQDGDVQRMYFSRLEWSQIGEKYFKEILAEPDKLAVMLTELRKAADELILFSRKFEKVAVEKLSPAKQLQWLEQYHKKHHEVWTIGMFPNVLDLENSFFADYLKSWLAKQSLNKQEQTEAFRILVTPAEFSMAQKEEREILFLAEQKDSRKELKKHWQKYKWIHFGWTGPSLGPNYFIEIHHALRQEGRAKDRLKEILEKDEKLIKDKRLYLKNLVIPEEYQELFRLFEELLFMKAHRMDALFMSFDSIQPLLKKIAKTNHLSLKQLYSLDLEWLMEMIKKDSLDIDKINNIAKYSVRYFDGDKEYLLIKDKAKDLAKQATKNLPKVKDQVELKGESAYPGKVQGKVSVINLAKEMDKFCDGDILVSNATDPSLLPVMKKAKAFVTDMGGLTCHAAIVARELEIPCIVGIKSAAKILKDGDQVEVDATKGVVRKL